MKRWMPVLCIALFATSFLGASAWEGSAMMSAYGEFPDSGYYAACNSFPRNTAVEVVNLENGRSVTVIVTKGLENPGIFLLLSPEAAKALSLEPGSLSRVRVTAPRNIAATPPTGSGPGGDPDFNPSLLASRAGVYPSSEEPVPVTPAEPAPEAALTVEIPPETGTAVEEPKPAELEPEKDAELEPAVEVAAVPSVEEEPEPSMPAEEPDVLASAPKGAVNGTQVPETREAPVARPEILARTSASPGTSTPVTAPIEPPETLETERRPEEKALVHGLNRPSSVSLPVEAALADPVLEPDELPDTALIRKAWPEESEPKVALPDLEIRMDESGKPEALVRSAGNPPAEERTPEVGLEEPVPVAAAEPVPAAAIEEPATPAEPPAAGDSEVVVSLEPTSPRPPRPVSETVPASTEGTAVATGTAAPVTPVPPAGKPGTANAEALPPAEGLVPGMYYIQVGAFRSSPSLDAAASRLRDTFPVTVDTVQAGSGPVYRLFVGPLGRDEMGVALLRVRSLGFKEAFLKN